MLFVAEYELSWENLEVAIAKRLEWDAVQPAGFRFVAEYIWQQGSPPFRGVAVFEADSVEEVNGFVLHYGPSLTMRVHPASDVRSSIAALESGATPSRPARKQPSGVRRGR
jgi:Domain of unknown function (DUF3303)